MKRYICVLLVLLLLCGNAYAATAKKTKRAYSELRDWELSGKNPSVTLVSPSNKKTILFFQHDDNMLVLPYEEGSIPKGTRFKVPEGYVAYCIQEHTRKLSGIGYVIDTLENAQRVVQYSEGANIEYTSASGLVIMDSKYAVDVHEPSYSTKSNTALISENPEDVIPSYGLTPEETEKLIGLHEEAAAIKGNRKKLAAYQAIVRAYQDDYLALYYAGRTSYDMKKYQDAYTYFVNACRISPNPGYSPAYKWREKVKPLVLK